MIHLIKIDNEISPLTFSPFIKTNGLIVPEMNPRNPVGEQQMNGTTRYNWQLLRH